jgi:hypothetical protein
MEKLTNDLKKVENHINDKCGKELNKLYEGTLESCREVLTTIKGIRRPMLRPVVLELTDKGPGVGCHNKDIKI